MVASTITTDAGIVLSIPVGVTGALITGLSERQIVIIHLALQAMEQAHKRRPTFLTKKGITLTEIEELKAILEGCGDSKAMEAYR